MIRIFGEYAFDPDAATLIRFFYSPALDKSGASLPHAPENVNAAKVNLAHQTIDLKGEPARALYVLLAERTRDASPRPSAVPASDDPPL